ncbi:MAG: GIY-YIG nuclease family protein [Anaerolineales bacterium]|nr:GIY-YIG nuclease family protein [Anaerolineales bacterium]
MTIPCTYSVYLLASQTRTLYVGMTSDLQRRLWEHKTKRVPGFTSIYDVSRLVYYETTSDVKVALAREKEIKAWRREKKIKLIEAANPDWQDLSTGWAEEP